MELLPKVLKKIGLGIISLGLISTFYIPEAKVGRTILEFQNEDGITYVIKETTPPEVILKKSWFGK